MRKLSAALLIYLGLASAALAQTKFTMPPPAGVSLMGLQVVTTCGAASGLANGNIAFATMDTTGTICTASGGGGGGGGLAIVDGAAFTASTSTFTPVGGEYAASPTTCADGKQCTAALTANRELRTHDTDVLTAVQAPITDCGATPCTNKIGVVGVNTWGGSLLGAGSNFGTTPGAVVVPGVNASMFMGTAIISATNGIYSNLLQGNAVISATNGLFANQLQGNAALSATNGGFQNILQGNAVLSATNGIYSNMMVGNAAVATGTGAQGATAPRFTIATDQATNGGAALVKGGVGTVNGGSDYETVAASQTAQALGATGATGDYLSHCVLQPTTTAAGTMTILDNATVIFTFTTGTLSNLAPIAIPIGANSVSGAWKVTTGANETATCFGKFT